MHLGEHHVATLAGALVLTHGIIIGGIFHHADKRGGLLDSQVFGGFAEIDVSRALDAHGIVEKVKLVEIHLYNLLFGVISLELDGYHPFDRLLHGTREQSRTLRRVKLLGQLLGERRASAGILVAHKHRLEQHTAQSAHIDTRMFLKAYIFGRNQRVDDVLRHLVKISIHSIAHAVEIAAYFLAV